MHFLTKIKEKSDNTGDILDESQRFRGKTTGLGQFPFEKPYWLHSFDFMTPCKLTQMVCIFATTMNFFLPKVLEFPGSNTLEILNVGKSPKQFLDLSILQKITNERIERNILFLLQLILCSLFCDRFEYSVLKISWSTLKSSLSAYL